MTEEIVREPVAAASWDWRLSIATVDTAGPFSVFSGVDRHLAVLSGAGLVLSTPAGVTTIASGAVHRFAGEDAVTCELVSGPTRDLNLMTRRAACEGELVHYTVDGTVDLADVVAVVVVASRTLRYRGTLLVAEDVCLARGHGPTRCTLTGTGTVAAVRVTPRTPHFAQTGRETQ